MAFYISVSGRDFDLYIRTDSLASVSFAVNLGHIWSRDFAPVQLVPVDFCEPPMGKYIRRARSQITVSLSEVPDQ